MAYFRGFGNRSKGEARSEWSRMRAFRRRTPKTIPNPRGGAMRVVRLDNPQYRNAAMREASAYKQFRHVALEDDILQMLAQRVPEDVALKITDFVGGYE